MNNREIENRFCCLSNRLAELENNVTVSRSEPSATDDSDSGFSQGDIWIDEYREDIYILRDATPGSAVWEKIPLDQWDVEDELNNLPLQIPDGVTRMVSTKLTGNITISVTSPSLGATGSCVSVNGGAATYVGGVGSHLVPSAGGGLVTIDFWPATSATSGPVGEIALNAPAQDLIYLNLADNFTSASAFSNPDLVQFKTRWTIGEGNSLSLAQSGIRRADLTAGNGGFIYLANSPDLEEVNISGMTGLQVFSCDNCPNLTRVIAVGCDGAAYSSSSSYYAIQLSSTGMTTDAIYSMIDGMADAAPYPPFTYPVLINVNSTPASPAGALVDGSIYTAAELASLAATKGYTLIL